MPTVPRDRPEHPVPLRPAAPATPLPPDGAAPIVRAGRRIMNAASTSLAEQVRGWQSRRDLDSYIEDPQWRPAAVEEPSGSPRHATAVLLAALALLALGVTLVTIMIF